MGCSPPTASNGQWGDVHSVQSICSILAMLLQNARYGIIRAQDEMWMNQIQPHSTEVSMEPILIFAGKEKVTSDSGCLVRFWAHRQLARSFFAEKKILDTEAFDLVDWKAYYAAMHAVPHLFQLWACKQTMGIAATNLAQARFTEGLSKLCPSCQVEEETCGHILKCNERGRVEALKTSVGLLDRWMAESNTEPRLRHVLVQYAASRGTLYVFDLCHGMTGDMCNFAQAQDTIGWRRFMEGMIAEQVGRIQRNYWNLYGWRGSMEKWVQTLITKLMECTHGQWLYRNVMVHDAWHGSAIALRKEELLGEIEAQLDSEESLLPEDQYLMEVNLGNIDNSSGEDHEYWLLAVKAARVAKELAGEVQGIG